MSDALVQLRTWRQVSASQITSFDTCQRLWYHRSILGKKTPPTAAQARGTAIHAEQEHYLRTGTVRPSEYAAIVRAMSGHLPDPGPRADLLIEHELGQPAGAPDAPRGKFAYGVKTVGDIKMVGYIDFAELSALPEVGDAKTTSDFRYCKTPAELRENVQLNIYTKFVLDDLTGAKKAQMSHVYGRTRGKPAAHRVDVIVERDAVFDRWIDILMKVEAMKDIADAHPNVNQIKPTTSVCDNLYGNPCPYRADCGFTTLVGGADMAQGMTLKEKLLAARAASQAQQEAGAAAPATPPAPSALGQAPAAAAPATPSPQPAAPASSPSGLVQVKPAPLVIGVLPPDAPSRETTDADVAAEVPKEAASKKRGRPKKEVSVTIEGVEIAAEDPDKPAREMAAKPEFKKALEMGRLVLYVDCLPSKYPDGPVMQDANDWLAPIKKAICEAQKVTDYRFLDYGKAKAALATGIRAQIEVSGLPALLCVSSGASGMDVLIEELTPHATIIIRGTK